MPYRIGKLIYLSCCYTSRLLPFVAGSAPCSALDPALSARSRYAIRTPSHLILLHRPSLTHLRPQAAHVTFIYTYTHAPQANYPMNRSCANFVTQRSPSRAAPAARTPCARRPASRSARGSFGSAPGSRCPVGSTAPGNGDTGTASPPTPHPLQILLLSGLPIYEYLYVIYIFC